SALVTVPEASISVTLGGGSAGRGMAVDTAATTVWSVRVSSASTASVNRFMFDPRHADSLAYLPRAGPNPRGNGSGGPRAISPAPSVRRASLVCHRHLPRDS